MSIWHCLLIPLLSAGPVWGAISASGDYDEDLIRVYRGIKIGEFSRDVCAEEFPLSKTDNAQAYVAWYAQNQPLIDDISQRVKVMARRKASAEPNPTKRTQVYVSYVELPADRAAVREALVSRGNDNLLLTCATWSHLPMANIERDWAAPLATVRRFPAH